VYGTIILKGIFEKQGDKV